MSLLKSATLKSFWRSNFAAANLLFNRSLCSAQKVFKTLTFSEVQKELEKENTVLLDVREQGELTTDGQIPKGKNVPVGSVLQAFQLNYSDFEEKYGFKKPSTFENIVVHCKAGVRAQLAAKALSQLGYNNIKVYPGINDWKENGGKLTKK